MRRLHVHIQMNESATYQLKQLRSERSLKKAQLKAAGVDVGDDEGDHRGLANVGATTPSPRGKGKKAKGSPKRSARSGDQETRPQPRASWLAKASQAASQALALPDSTEGRRTPSPRQSPRQSPRPSTLPQIGEDTVASVGRASVFFKEDHSDRSRSSSASSGFFARPTLKKRNTIDHRPAEGTVQPSLHPDHAATPADGHGQRRGADLPQVTSRRQQVPTDHSQDFGVETCGFAEPLAV